MSDDMTTAGHRRPAGPLNRPDLIGRRRSLRQDATRAEKALWRHFRGRRAAGLKFRRQHSIGPYIADFCCAEARLVIEVDGVTHETTAAEERDHARTEYFEHLGFQVLRYSNDEVLRDAEAVSLHAAERAKELVGSRSPGPTSPLPSPWKGEGEHTHLLPEESGRA